MKIYFDNELINEDYYKSLTNSHELFNSSFALGSTASNTFELELDAKASNTVPSNVKFVDENNNDFASLVIDKDEEEDKYTRKLKLTDKLVDLNYYYDASSLILQKGGSVLTSEILEDMCSKVGIEVDENITWINDISVTWYDNTILARDYAGYIAEMNAGYVAILPDGKLTIKQHNTASKFSINIDDCEDFVLGTKFQITKVVYDNGIVKYEAGNDTGNTIYINSENVFIVNQSQIDNIYNSIKNFEFYNISTGNCPINGNVHAGDVITFIDGDNEYPTIANVNMTYNVGWYGGYSLDINNQRQDETDLIGTNSKIKSITSRLNRDEAQLEIVANETSENTSKIGTLEIGFEEIVQQVSSSITLTKDVSNITSLTVEDAFEVDALKLSIIGEMSLLYPNNDLYPSDDLYPLDSYLIIEDEDENTNKVLLPITYLHYLNATTYDEFVVENGQAKIIRRVGENSDGSLYALTTETIEDKGTCEIPLNTGYNKLYLESFFDKALQYNLKYVYQNDYTDTFATKLEMHTEIEQTASEINLEVSKKVGENEVISAINLTSEAAKIIASRIQLEGLVTANNNFKVLLDGSIEAVNGKFSGTITADSGTIGGASIDSQGVFFNSGNNGWGLWGTTSHDNIVFHAGSTTSSIGTAPFRVKADGSMYATAGKIADFTISGAQLIGNNVGLSGTAGQGYAFWSGSNTAGSAPFRVGHDGSLVATSATITGNISSSNISGSNITGGSIRIESTGFFAFGTGTTHPWASAINVTGLYGVNFYSGTSASNTGTQQGYIDMGGSNGALEVISPYTDVVIGGYHVKLSAREGYVYASRNGSTNYLVSTESGNISSLNLKENIKIFDDDEYNRAYQLLQKIDFYRYDYKYKISENKKEYGFIIDYIEKNNGYDDFLYFYKQQANVENNELDYLVEDTDENVIEFKKYNEENLLKYVFTLLKCMQKKIDKLESEKNHE